MHRVLPFEARMLRTLLTRLSTGRPQAPPEPAEMPAVHSHLLMADGLVLP